MIRHARARLSQIYYGWLIVGGAVIGQYAWLAGRGQVNGVFLEPITTELGWTVAQFTLASSVAFLAGGFAGLLIGPMVDRYGPRPLMVTGAVLYGGALLLTSQISELWHFITLQILSGGIAAALVGPLVVNVAISRWFVLRRGWALSIGSMGVSLGTAVLPLTLTMVVDGAGWRAGYVTLSALIFVPLVLAAPLMRRSPEDYGLLPDGRRPDGDGANDDDSRALALIQSDHDRSLTRAQALRQTSLWLLVVAFGTHTAAQGAIFVHGIPFVTEAGFDRTVAAGAFSVIGLANFSSKFLWGWGIQRFAGRHLATGAFLSSALGVLLIVLSGRLDELPVLIAGFIFFGIGFGGTIPLGEFLWASYFGRRYLGAVRSVGLPFTVLFGAAGPIAVALAFDASGRYEPAFITIAAVYGIAALAIGMSRRPAAPARPV